MSAYIQLSISGIRQSFRTAKLRVKCGTAIAGISLLTGSCDPMQGLCPGVDAIDRISLTKCEVQITIRCHG